MPDRRQSVDRMYVAASESGFTSYRLRYGAGSSSTLAAIGDSAPTKPSMERYAMSVSSSSLPRTAQLERRVPRCSAGMPVRRIPGGTATITHLQGELSLQEQLSCIGDGPTKGVGTRDPHLWLQKSAAIPESARSQPCENWL